MNIISKIGTTPSAPNNPKTNEPTSPAATPTSKAQGGPVPSALSTVALSVPGSMDTSVVGLSESQLKRQGLECLVTVLRSLVAWGTAATTVDDTVATPSVVSHVGEDIRRDSGTPDGSLDKLSAAGASMEGLRQPTPELVDDPTKFESAKQKKTTLFEGVKKFNFKPKRVDLRSPNNLS